MGRAAYPRYYYNKRFGKCTKFRYSGCGGNSNRFETKEGCEEKCADNVSRTKLSSNSLCNLPKLEGPCRAAYPRYYYNKRFGECTKFRYSGCGVTPIGLKPKRAVKKNVLIMFQVIQ